MKDKNKGDRPESVSLNYNQAFNIFYKAFEEGGWSIHDGIKALLDAIHIDTSKNGQLMVTKYQGEKCGCHQLSIGGILNAFMAGDISFDVAVNEIKLVTRNNKGLTAGQIMLIIDDIEPMLWRDTTEKIANKIVESANTLWADETSL